MTALRNRLLPLVLTILPVVIVGAGSLWGTRYMLEGIETSVNEQEHNRTTLAVQSAFQSLQRQFDGLMVDNAPWDDAVANTYGNPNQQWLYDTWGISSRDENYDTSFILQSNGSVIAAFQAGEVFASTPEDYFGAGFAELFAPMPLNNIERLDQSSLIELAEPGRFALIGLGRILPTTEGLPAPAGQPNVLVFSRTLTPALLADLAREYAVDDLALLPATATSPADSLLHSALGEPVAMAAWTPRDPGLAARVARTRAASIIVFALIGLLVPVSLAYFRLVSLLQAGEHEARMAARHDPLSGLPNRTLLLESLEIHARTGSSEPLTLLFIDLDGFKAVNDAYDHSIGDMLIRHFGQGLLALTTPRDLVARLGGDEFAIVLRGEEGRARTEALARHIITFAQQPFNIEGKVLSIGASIGIAGWTPELSDPAEFMRRADLAMYSAKESGRNTWCHFSAQIDENRSEDLLVAARLRAHLAADRMHFFYQPIVDAQSHRITGVEALARWPEAEGITTSNFIRVAEEHGLVEELFRKLLVCAMNDLKPFEGIKLSLNVSALQIINHRIVNDIVNAAGVTGFPLNRLELEFTESHLIRNPTAARLLILHLQRLNIRIALDDFGTGFASLGYLRDFSFNTIKLDQSLTRDVFSDDSSRKIVQGTIAIASGLSSDIVAEGVETREQATFMTQAGCHSLQGFFFHRPAGISELQALLAAPDSAENDRRSA